MVYAILMICLVIGVPVAFSIVAALLYFMAVGDFPYNLRLVATQMYGGLKSFPLLAIPLFILAGELMNESGITSRIIAFANILVGNFRAGLAMVNIWSSVIFAGLSGSAVADTSAIGRVFIPEMVRKGYPADFAAAITAASSVIGPIIPPSIPVIIYALTVTGVSVPALFLGGIGPGLLLAILLSIYVMIFAGDYETADSNKTRVAKRKILIQGIIPLLMPIFVVGSILLGVVTPTEAASFAVAYALIVGLFIFRELKWSALPGIFGRSMRDSSVIMIVIGAVAAGNWLLTYNRVPNMITDFALAFMTAKWMFLISNYMGADITVLDINQAKMEKAKCFNKTITMLHPGQVQNQAFDVVIEAAGAKAAIELAFLLVKPGGELITLGITNDDVKFPSLHVTRSEITIYGSIVYTKKDFEDALGFLIDPAFDVSPVLSKIVPLKEYEKAFADALTGNFTKIILDFRDKQ